MQLPDNVNRSERTIGGKRADGTPWGFKVQVARPYAAGHTINEGEANILNQTIAENVSNNLRDKLANGRPAVEANAETGAAAEPARDFTLEEAQALVDAYLKEYEPGTRRAGSGAPRITDPVEREALNLAGERVTAFLKEKEIDRKTIDFADMRQKLFEKRREDFMRDAKKIVDARNKSTAGTADLMDDLVDYLPGVGQEDETAGEAANAE